MAVFRYRVRDKQGKLVEGVSDGDSAEQVLRILAGQGYIPIQVKPERASGAWSPRALFRRVSAQERNVFTRQLLTLQRAGVPLVTGLSSLHEQARGSALREVLGDLIKHLEAGDSFSAALSRHPDVFDLMYVQMVKAGEAAGKLDEILVHLSDLGEFETETKERIRSATRYPLITFATLVSAFFLVVTIVIPRFTQMYEKFGAELPLPTRVLLAINHAVRYDWLQWSIALAAAVFIFRVVAATEAGGYQWDRLKLRVPVFGPLYFNLIMGRFSRVLAELLASGIPILQALQLVSDTVANLVVRRAVTQIRQSVSEGKGMAEPMRRSGLFSPMVHQMVAVGEQSGKTDELLRYVADYYRSQAGYMMKNLTTLIEPMLIFIIGGFVMLLALGVFLPLWDMMSVIKR